MWSPATPVSSENQKLGTQTIGNRKSVGRTTLKALDPNSLHNHRLSLAKPSSNTDLLDKETSLVATGNPVSIWVDTDDSLANSGTRSSFTLENKLQVKVTEASSNMKIDYQYSQRCENVLISELISSNQAQEVFLENKDIKCLEGGCKTMVSSTFEAANDETSSTDGQQAVPTIFDVCSNTVTKTFLETSSYPHTISLNKENVSDYAHCTVLTTEVNEFPHNTGDIGCISESKNVLSANKTYDIVLNCDGESEDRFFPLLGEIAHLTQTDTHSDCIVHGLKAKKLPLSLQGDVVNEDKIEQTVDVLSTCCDCPVVLDKPNSIGNHVLGDECFLSLDTHAKNPSAMDGDICSCSIENFKENGLNMRESPDKCFFPMTGSTPHFKLEPDATKVTYTDYLTPRSNLQQTDPSSLASDPQRSEEVAASAKWNCPTPVIPSSTHEVLSLGRHLCNVLPEVMASFHEVGTAMTPSSTAEGITWTTPVMCLNKSMNTSWNMKGKGVKSAKDNASETDSLVWNFSKEAICNASREELIHRLEGSLIVVEVLSRQFQDWQQLPVTSKPSEQRDASTQTYVTYDSDDESFYRNLYFKTLTRQQSLQRCHEDEKKLHKVLQESAESLSSYNEDFDQFAERACSVCSEMEDDRNQLLVQCSEARELMSRHWHLLKIMKERAQLALENYDGIKDERDDAIMENKEVFSHLEDVKSVNEQLRLENSRLGSELETLMERLCSLESEIDKWKEDNSELGEQLSARDSSMKLLEKELNEATERGQTYQDRMKNLTLNVVPSLELKLSDVSSQKKVLQARLQALEEDHALQIDTYRESLEFLEQENYVCREQVAETESLLKGHHLNLLERNYQFENLKDTVKELEKDVTELKQKLADTEYETQNTKAKAAKEISSASNEVSKIKAQLLDVISNLKESSQKEVKVNAYGLHTPGGSLTLCNTFTEESNRKTILSTTDFEHPKAEGIWSETSAFTVVQPPLTGTPSVNLADLLNELSSVVLDVVTTSSLAMDTKQNFIRNLKMDISSLKEELQNQRSQHKSDVRVLEVEVENLRKRYVALDEKLTMKEKYSGELQNLVHQRDQKILQQITKLNDCEDLVQENSKLKLSLKQCESEVEILKRMLAQNSTDVKGKWIEEKVMMQKDLTSLNMKLSDAKQSKSEAIQRLVKHKDVLTQNLFRSEAEVHKLDAIIEKIREALFSVPDVVKQCDTLRQLMEFLK